MNVPKAHAQQATSQPAAPDETSGPEGQPADQPSTATRAAALDPDAAARRRAEAQAARRAEIHASRVATRLDRVSPAADPAPGNDAANALPSDQDQIPRAATTAFLVAPPKPIAAPAPLRATHQFRPTVSPSIMKARHFGLMLSFLLFVAAPVIISGWYLWARAADQYASYVGFSVQKEDTDPAVALLGGITNLSTSSSSDTDILYEYMYSQSLVAEIDAELDLRSLWSKPANDPVFSYAPPGTIEDLTDYWADMVKVFYDSNTRLIELRVLAFDPREAQAIAIAVYNKSSAMINKLAETSRADAVRYAKEELDVEKARLRAARSAVTAYRNINRMVDPSADVASQSGLLATLQAQLANALIELDSLRLSSQQDDPRIVPAERKVTVIEDRIEAERSKLGSGTGVDAAAYADLVAEYEGLAVDREFAEGAYRAALAAYDVAQAEARRQGRYLAAHIPPTLAEASRFPDRPVLLGLVALFAFTLWSIAALLYYSLRDRR